MRRARSGAVSAAELKEVQTVVTSPELRDAFRGVARDLSALVAGGTELVFRDVNSLTPDTERLTDARALPARFLADLKLVEQALLHHPGMTRGEKAQRVFAFFESYAARFQQLAHGEAQSAAQAAKGTPSHGALSTVETGLQLAPPLTAPELHKAMTQFDQALTRAGFHELRADDGRTGLEAARQMLEAKTAQAQAQARPNALDAPTWKDNPERALKAEVDRERRVAQLDGGRVQPQLQVAPRRLDEQAPQKDAGARRHSRGTDQVLGGNMLWNVLHLLRGEELDDVARKDAMTQLAIAAALLLILGGVLVGILVWM